MRVNYVILFFVLAGALGICSFAFPEGVGAIIMVTILSTLALPIVSRNSNDPTFITRLFFSALAIRILFGTIVYITDSSGFFGGDAYTYNFRAGFIVDYWRGIIPVASPEIIRWTATSGSGWGMHYLVAAIYFVFGKNALAAQAFCWAFGALIGPVVYICAFKMYKNSRVAKFSGILTAFFPAFVIWSSQLMKDGLVIFLLVIVIIAVLHLQEKFSLGTVVILVLAMFGILSLRFYIFYMVAIAAVGSFVVGLSNSPAAVMRRTAVLLIVGLGLTYLGVLRTASSEFEQFGSLERIQRSRMDLARSGESGFGEDPVNSPEIKSS
jgi:4-amino-4-deoxy-L-arabinose transferase-like glycosyltransferase